jgi:hypothetical protein
VPESELPNGQNMQNPGIPSPLGFPFRVHRVAISCHRLCGYFVVLSLLYACSVSGQIRKGTIGRGWRAAEPVACITGEEHRMLLDSISKIEVATPKSSQSEAFRLHWPLRRIPGFKGRDYYGISNFFDHNSLFPAVRDFFCGSRSYDLQGYNHNGTDIFLWPAFWRTMQEEQVDVVAAESGVIVLKTDGNFDQQCVWTNAQWNVVIIRHNDSLSTLYGHLKKNSLTSKSVGDSVTQGEYLGKVGSSGRSNGPHLHFELIRNNQSEDPYTGNCQPSASFWEAQRSYFDPQINLLETAAGMPVFPPCPQPEDLRTRDTFLLGDTVFLNAYFRDMRSGDSIGIWLERESGSVLDSLKEKAVFPEGFFDGAWWTWYFLMPDSGAGGWHRFHLSYQGNEDTARFFRLVPTQSQRKISFPFWKLMRHPERGTWEIQSSDPVTEIRIHDSFGRILRREMGNTREIRMPDIPGIYWIWAESKQSSRMFKVWSGIPGL